MFRISTIGVVTGLLVMHTVVRAQPLTDTIVLRASDRILQAAYDDTTRALAFLFLVKRQDIRKNRHLSYIALGSSAVLFSVAHFINERSENQPAWVKEGNSMGVTMMVVAGIGALYGGVLNLAWTEIRASSYREKNSMSWWRCIGPESRCPDSMPGALHLSFIHWLPTPITWFIT